MGIYPTGTVRFVGGPLHNQHKCVPMRPYISIPNYAGRELRKLTRGFEPMPEIQIERIDYVLHTIRSRLGAVYQEYHLDINETVESGEDFVCKPPPIAFEAFTMRLITAFSQWRFGVMRTPA